MASQHSPFGKLLKGYLFFVGKTETALSEAIHLSLNKVSAAVHGKYRLKRDHFDLTVATLMEWGVEMTAADYDEFMDAWRSLANSADCPLPPPPPPSSRIGIQRLRERPVLSDALDDPATFTRMAERLSRGEVPRRQGIPYTFPSGAMREDES